MATVGSNCVAEALGALAPECNSPALEPVACDTLTLCFRQFLCSVLAKEPEPVGTFSPVSCTADGKLFFCQCSQVRLREPTTEEAFNSSVTAAPDSSTAGSPDPTAWVFNTFAASPTPLPMAANATTTAAPVPTGGLGTGEIVGIALGVFLALALVAIAVVFAVRKIRERRKTQGVYFPKAEEERNVGKDAAYLPPPSIEGLI